MKASSNSRVIIFYDITIYSCILYVVICSLNGNKIFNVVACSDNFIHFITQATVCALNIKRPNIKTSSFLPKNMSLNFIRFFFQPIFSQWWIQDFPYKVQPLRTRSHRANAKEKAKIFLSDVCPLFSRRFCLFCDFFCLGFHVQFFLLRIDLKGESPTRYMTIFIKKLHENEACLVERRRKMGALHPLVCHFFCRWHHYYSSEKL